MMPATWPDPADLLPHGTAACCLDAIVAYQPGKGVRARWRVRASSMLYDPARSGVPAWGGIEIMAQCAGLYLGLSRSQRGHHQRPASGYLVGVRRFHATQAVLPGDAELAISANCETADLSAGGAGTFECRILCSANEGARAHLMLWCAEEAPGDS